MSNQPSDNVLVIGDDMRIFLAVARSLGRAGYRVHAAPFDWQAPALKSRYVSKIHFLTRYSDDPAAWLSEIKTIIAQNGVRVVIPCCDRAILPLDQHRSEFSDTQLAIPNHKAMEVLFDKLATKDFVQRLAIPVSAAEQLAPQLTAAVLVAKYGLPIVVKPKRSYSLDRLTTWGRVHIAETLQELEAVLASIVEPGRYLVEQYFKGGVGVGVSILADQGQILQAFQHQRLREGWGGSSSYRISQDCDPALLAAATKITTATQLHGVCMFEFRRNPTTGVWILLEVNARLWGSLPLPVSMGVDFPRALCDMLFDRPVQLPVRYQAGIRGRNVLLDGFNLLKATRSGQLGGIKAGLAAWSGFFAQPIWLMTGHEFSDSFTLDDPAPGFAEVAALLKRMTGLPSPDRDRRTGDKSTKRALTKLIRPAAQR